MNNYYIYIYLDSRKLGKYCYNDICFLYEPFYVGKGKNERYKIEYGRSNDFINIVNEIKLFESKPTIIKLYENLNEQQSFEFETKLINEIGRIDLGTGTLINKTSGGQGSSGRINSEETKNKISNKNKGKYHSKETKELMSEKKRKDFQSIKSEFEKRGYKLLTEENKYKNNHTKLKYICPEKHEGSIIWNAFRQGQGCPIEGKKLQSEKLIKDFQSIKSEFEKRRYILLMEENEYKNNKQKLKYICPEGHVGYMSWSNFQQEKSCPICYKENNNNGNYSPNHKLDEIDVIHIKLFLETGILNNQKIANIFGVSRSEISKIKTGRTWNHIKI